MELTPAFGQRTGAPQFTHKTPTHPHRPSSIQHENLKGKKLWWKTKGKPRATHCFLELCQPPPPLHTSSRSRSVCSSTNSARALQRTSTSASAASTAPQPGPAWASPTTSRMSACRMHRRVPARQSRLRGWGDKEGGFHSAKSNGKVGEFILRQLLFQNKNEISEYGVALPLSIPCQESNQYATNCIT